jgi:cytochrome c oxidase subunit 2
MIKISTIVLAGLLVAPLSLAATDGGKALYQACVACHGANAEGNRAMKAPALAGQQQAYLERQLRYFKQGIRGADPKDTVGAQMAAMAATLPTEQAVAEVSAYLAALPVSAVADPQSGDLRNGNNLYHAKCGACHGGNAEGNSSLNAPRLTGLSADYLKRQYHNFQQGLRGSNAADRFGRQMKMMSTSLPDEKALDDVIAYIQAQPVE